MFPHQTFRKSGFAFCGIFPVGKSLPMSQAFLLFALSSLIILAPAASAAGKAKGKANGGPPSAVAKPDATSPRNALQPYIVHVDQLLDLERPEGKQITALLKQAPGRLATLRQDFVAERQKAAEGDRSKFDAAIATCDLLTRALDERQKTAGEIEASSAVKGSTQIGAHRKDNLTQGISGGDDAKAVGSIVERDRERAAAHAAARRAQQGDNALTAMSADRWNKRSIELRKQITDSYGRISD
jgi:hypothetical protein